MTRRRGPASFSVRPVVLALPLLALLLLLGAPWARAAGPSRTFEEHNFRWELPSADWGFQEIGSEGEMAGWRARALRRLEGSYAMLDVRVAPTHDLSLTELTGEIEGVLVAQFQAEGVRRTAGRLSGLEGTKVRGKGMHGSHPAWIEVISVESGGVFHQMLLVLAGGAEVKLAEEVDAARRGYRLLKGAGPEEQPAKPQDPEEEDEEDDEGRVKGPPRKEGRALVFPSQNFRWTLPEGSPLEWGQIAADQSVSRGVLAIARASVPREDAREQDPQANRVEVRLFVLPAEPGFVPERWVEDRGLQDDLAEKFFTRASFDQTKVVPDTKVGGAKAAALQMAGAKDREVVFLRVYLVSLRGKRYEWQAIFTGGQEVYRVFGKAVDELMAGVKFADTRDFLRGPIGIAAVPEHTGERGRGHGKTEEFISPGSVKATKPKSLRSVKWQIAAAPELRFCWEGRSEDGEAYLYFDVQTWKMDTLRQQNRTAEDMIRERETQWNEHAGSPKTVVKGKDPFFRDHWKKQSGTAYRFEGKVADVPYVEKGWLVSAGRDLVWVRLQLGGEKADSKMKRVLGEIEKGFSFTK